MRPIVLIFFIISALWLRSQSRITDFEGEKTGPIRMIQDFDNDVYLFECIEGDEFLVSKLENNLKINSKRITLPYFNNPQKLFFSNDKIYYQFGGDIFIYQPSTNVLNKIQHEDKIGLILNLVTNENVLVYTSVSTKINMLYNQNTGEKYIIGNGYDFFSISDSSLFAYRYKDGQSANVIRQIDKISLKSKSIEGSIQGEFTIQKMEVFEDSIIYFNSSDLLSKYFRNGKTNILLSDNKFFLSNSLNKINDHYFITVWSDGGISLLIYDKNFKIINLIDKSVFLFGDLSRSENLTNFSYNQNILFIPDFQKRSGLIYYFTTNEWSIINGTINFPFLVEKTNSSIKFSSLFGPEKFEVPLQPSSYVNNTMNTNADKIVFLPTGPGNLFIYDVKNEVLHNYTPINQPRTSGLGSFSSVLKNGQDLFLNIPESGWFFILNKDLIPIKKVNDLTEYFEKFNDKYYLFSYDDEQALTINKITPEGIIKVIKVQPEIKDNNPVRVNVISIFETPNHIFLFTNRNNLIAVNQKNLKIEAQYSTVNFSPVLHKEKILAIINNKLTSIDQKLKRQSFEEFEFSQYDNLDGRIIGNDLFIKLKKKTDDKRCYYRVTDENFIKENYLCEFPVENTIYEKKGEYTFAIKPKYPFDTFYVYIKDKWLQLNDLLNYHVLDENIIFNNSDFSILIFNPNKSQTNLTSLPKGYTINKTDKIGPDLYRVFMSQNLIGTLNKYLNNNYFSDIKIYETNADLTSAKEVYNYKGYPQFASYPMIFTIDGIKVLDKNYNETHLNIYSDELTSKNVVYQFNQYYFLAQDKYKNRQVYSYQPFSLLPPFVEERKIKIFPNPSSFQIVFETYWKNCINFEIHNTYGQSVYNHKSYERIVNIIDLPNGIYYVRCTCENKQATGVFLKN